MGPLKAFLKSLPDESAREQFAAQCKTTLGHLRNVMYGQRPCSAELAALLDRESGGKVSRRAMRPDDWFDIWPELVASRTPKPNKRLERAA